MSYSKILDNKRAQLKGVMDNFTTFCWGLPSEGYKNAFEEFGAFIVGGKDALKFYNGPGFSNKYISTQFQTSNTTLQSVEFKTMTVSFTMGVYWFTIEEYRQLLLWLHPYEVNTLSFSFAPEWFYTAKLANISDSTRHILGKDSAGEYRYYTEIKLTFDIQGEPCLHNFINYAIERDPDQKTDILWDNVKWSQFRFTQSNRFPKSDLDTPFEFAVTMVPTEGGLYPSQIKFPSNNDLFPQQSSENENTNEGNKGYYIALEVEIRSKQSTDSPQNMPHLVFEAFLSNLAWEDTGGVATTFIYDSSQGFLFLGGDGELLSSQTTSFSGKRIVEALNVKSFKLPGELESGLLAEDLKNTRFKLYYSNNWTPDINSVVASYISHARTNVI